MGRKWANIEKKKGAADKLRSQIYTKILFDVSKAVKSGGAEASTNFLLKVALEKCKKIMFPEIILNVRLKRHLVEVEMKIKK